MKELLKFITCGSVDDGKSTLIGRLLYDSKLLFSDQLQTLELDSKVGSRNGEIDYSLLLDGLSAEREQGITIDVAYRFFSTTKRSFIVADTPGHEEYTRNMAVGASFADLAIILIDSSKGILEQTKRHTRICSLMGIKHFVLAVNKMDLVRYNKKIFEKIVNDFKKILLEFKNFNSFTAIPVTATEGINVKNRSDKTNWYKGPTLFEYLEKVNINIMSDKNNFIMPVQRVSRPNQNFRGYQGKVISGEIKVNDFIDILPSDQKAQIKKILNAGKETSVVKKGDSVTIQLNKELDISRGSVLAQNHSLFYSDMFSADLLWMDDDTLIEGKNYLIKIGTKILPCSVMKIKYKIDINNGNEIPSKNLYKNELARVNIVVSENIIYDEFKNNQEIGSFILIDRYTNMTSAVGTILYELRRSKNVVWHETLINKQMRENLKNQKAFTIWFTGLSGSGKSSIANELERRLFSLGKHTMILDGDNIRHGLNRNLGFTDQDRIENIRRVSEVAKILNDAGIITLVSFISPFYADREEANKVIGKNFYEIYVSTPLEICEKRDTKGLYKKARNGEIPNFTGINSLYQRPKNPFINLDTTKLSIQESVDLILKKLNLQ